MSTLPSFSDKSWMKSLHENVKDFLARRLLRNFSYRTNNARLSVKIASNRLDRPHCRRQSVYVAMAMHDVSLLTYKCMRITSIIDSINTGKL